MLQSNFFACEVQMEGVYNYAKVLWFGSEAHSNVIQATPENLQKSIEEKGEEVFKCHFIEGSTRYNPFEYAIHIEDVNSVKILCTFKKNEASPLCKGTIIHYYISELKENKIANLTLLHHLLNYIQDINEQQIPHWDSPLEYALRHMSSYKQIHWNVIKMLFERGAQIKSDSHKTPFLILKYSRSSEPKTYVEQCFFLLNLATYASLEKKYYPDSSNAHLSLDEFKRLSSCIPGTFIYSLNRIDSRNYTLNLDEEDDKDTVILNKFREDLSKPQINSAAHISFRFIAYNLFFEQLVYKRENKIKFKNCFSDHELNSIEQAIKKMNPNSKHTITLKRILFEIWG